MFPLAHMDQIHHSEKLPVISDCGQSGMKMLCTAGQGINLQQRTIGKKAGSMPAQQ